MGKEYTYNAFISYRHLPLDGAVAEKIQKDSNEWNDRIKNLDDKQKNDIENIGIYEMSIKNSSEQTFTLPENKTVRSFMPCPAGWYKNDLQVVHISAGLDEDFTEEITTVNGQHYCTFKTTHFSPYAIIDEISKNDIFEMMAPWLIGAAVIAIGAAAVVIVLKNKSKSRA